MEPFAVLKRSYPNYSPDGQPISKNGRPTKPIKKENSSQDSTIVELYCCADCVMSHGPKAHTAARTALFRSRDKQKALQGFLVDVVVGWGGRDGGNGCHGGHGGRGDRGRSKGNSVRLGSESRLGPKDPEAIKSIDPGPKGPRTHIVGSLFWWTHIFFIHIHRTQKPCF